jgi:hypothetical protein
LLNETLSETSDDLAHQPMLPLTGHHLDHNTLIVSLSLIPRDEEMVPTKPKKKLIAHMVTLLPNLSEMKPPKKLPVN